MSKKLIFKIPFKQFRPGDAVPEQWDAGVKATMVAFNRAEYVDATPAAKVCVPEADKMVRPSAKLKRKGAGE